MKLYVCNECQEAYIKENIYCLRIDSERIFICKYCLIEYLISVKGVSPEEFLSNKIGATLECELSGLEPVDFIKENLFGEFISCYKNLIGDLYV